MKVILHPTDFSTNSDRAFATACSIARDQEALLVVLHVINPTACDPEDLAQTGLTPGREHYQHVWDQFNRLKEMAANTRMTYRIKVGDVVDSIIRVARDEHCEMIILAGRNNSEEHYRVHGCISEALIRHANCSVLMLRHFHASGCCHSPVDVQHQTPTATDSACLSWSEMDFASTDTWNPV